jgi:hypothetical protein
VAEELPADVEHAETNYAIGTSLLGGNGRVNLWDVQLEPGERSPFHCHRTSYLVITHQGGLARAGFADGGADVFPHHAGEVTYVQVKAGDRLIHDLTNVGETPLGFTIVELLDGDRLSWRAYEGELERGD